MKPFLSLQRVTQACYMIGQGLGGGAAGQGKWDSLEFRIPGTWVQ